MPVNITPEQWRAARAAEAERIAGSRVRSKCINCGEVRACIKIEARAPLSHTTLVWNAALGAHDAVDYETHGPMVEICRACLAGDIGTLAKYMLEAL